jgi:hypothetical protein
MALEIVAKEKSIFDAKMKRLRAERKKAEATAEPSSVERNTPRDS